jgi:hypothetical protein
MRVRQYAATFALVVAALLPAPVAAQTIGYVYGLARPNFTPTANFLYGVAVDASGQLIPLPGFPILTGGNGAGIAPERVVYDAVGRRLYAANDASNSVSVWSVNNSTGALTALPFSPIVLPAGFGGCISLNPSGSVLVVGGASSGAPGVVAYRIAPDGTPTQAAGSPFATGAAFPASCTFSRDGAYFYAGGGGSSSRLFAGFSIDHSTGVLTPLPGSPFDAGLDYAVGYQTDGAGRLLAVTDAIPTKVLAFTTSTGVPTGVAGNPFPNPQSFPKHGLLHPAGYYLTSGTMTSDIGVFRVGGSGPGTTLTAVAGSPFYSGGSSGGGSSTSVVDQTGRFIITTGGDTRNLTLLDFNPATGALTLLQTTPPGSQGASGGIYGLAFAPFGSVGLPTVATGTATAILPSTATLNGTVNPNGSFTTAQFQYGPTASYGSTTPSQALGFGSSAVGVGGGGLTGLACGSLYHYRATATNTVGEAYGPDATFITAPCPAPATATGAASAITLTAATLNGAANPNGTATTAYFQYGLTTGYGGLTPVQSLGAGLVDVAIGGGSITGLRCGTVYHFRAVAWNGAGTTNGTDATFATMPCAVAGDFDRDQMTDVTVYRPSTGVWYVLQSSTNYTTYATLSFGLSTDVPVPGDYDGDGKADAAVYRPSTGVWHILQSSSNYTTALMQSWGLSTDIPVPADYDGDSKTDLGLYRPSTGTWYVLLSSANYSTMIIQAWGAGTDIPLPGDYDGDGKADLGLYRPSNGTWYILKSSTNYSTPIIQPWGLAADIAVPGDYDGDGKIDPALYRPSTGVWYILKSSTNYATAITQTWGLSSDVALPGDYDGDGRTDLALFRPSTGVWYILQSRTNYTTYLAPTWGLSTDVPVLKRP